MQPMDMVRLDDQLRAVDATLGGRLLFAWRELDDSFYALVKNASDALSIDRLANSDDVLFELWDIDNRDDLDRLAREASRRFLNFLGSARALADHTSRHVAEFDDKNFQREYQAHIADSMLGTPTHQLVQGLRNISQHRVLPLSGSAFTMKRSGGQDSEFESTHSFVIGKAFLLAAQTWQDPVVEYLNRSPGSADDTVGQNDVDMAWLVRSYTEMAIAMHRWLRDREAEIRSGDIREYEVLRNALLARDSTDPEG
jgi:hypothetical protein